MPHLIRIGNSFGVRIPKNLINQMGFKENADLIFKVTDEGLLISSLRQNRENWEEAFKVASKDLENSFLIGDEIVNTFDKDEWEW